MYDILFEDPFIVLNMFTVGVAVLGYFDAEGSDFQAQLLESQSFSFCLQAQLRVPAVNI